MHACFFPVVYQCAHPLAEHVVHFNRHVLSLGQHIFNSRCPGEWVRVVPSQGCFKTRERNAVAVESGVDFSADDDFQVAFHSKVQQRPGGQSSVLFRVEKVVRVSRWGRARFAEPQFYGLSARFFQRAQPNGPALSTLDPIRAGRFDGTRVRDGLPVNRLQSTDSQPVGVRRGGRVGVVVRVASGFGLGPESKVHPHGVVCREGFHVQGVAARIDGLRRRSCGRAQPAGRRRLCFRTDLR